jgi:hypothetical protein
LSLLKCRTDSKYRSNVDYKLCMSSSTKLIYIWHYQLLYEPLFVSGMGKTDGSLVARSSHDPILLVLLMLLLLRHALLDVH